MTPGLTATIAEHIAGLPYAALPATTVAATKRALLDGVGVMLAASGLSEDCRPFVELSKTRGGPRLATILGHGRCVPPASAAFANGAMAHALDYEDAFDFAPVHPNASLIPAALATAEAYGPTSGRELIVATAIGCDLVCRLGLSLRRSLEEGGWYPPPILGAFGAVAASARLLRLSPRQIADSFSLLMCQVSCPGEIKHSADTVIRAIREAFPAQAAVTSAELAARGIAGFDAPLEGKAGFFRLYVSGDYDPAAIEQGLGSRFWIERLSFKPWPACRGTHAFIELGLRLRHEHDLDWRTIVEVRLTGAPIHRMLVEPAARKARPATAIDAKFSLPHTVALALRRGHVTLDDFDAGGLGDGDIHALADKVSFIERSEGPLAGGSGGSVEIVLADGRSLAATVEQAIGNPDRPLDDDRLREKFLDCASRSADRMSRAAADRLADRIFDLEQLEDIGALWGSPSDR